jgi:hypothetical protein
MKLAFIVPTTAYRFEKDQIGWKGVRSKEEESLREKLFYHLEYFLKDKEKLDWKLFFI